MLAALWGQTGTPRAVFAAAGALALATPRRQLMHDYPARRVAKPHRR